LVEGELTFKKYATFVEENIFVEHTVTACWVCDAFFLGLTAR
jgi:hypothetical protein